MTFTQPLLELYQVRCGLGRNPVADPHVDDCRERADCSSNGTPYFVKRKMLRTLTENSRSKGVPRPFSAGRPSPARCPRYSPAHPGPPSRSTTTLSADLYVLRSAHVARDREEPVLWQRHGRRGRSSPGPSPTTRAPSPTRRLHISAPTPRAAPVTRHLLLCTCIGRFLLRWPVTGC